MKTVLELVTAARDFALETIDAKPGADLTTRTLQAFQDAKGNDADWALWNETVNNERGQMRKIQNDPLPSQIPAPAPKA